MGTIADKLTYLNTTKSQLKDMINYGLDDNNKITNSTTFRNYVSSIFNAFIESLRTPDTLFTNLPKKSGTGANITLNDTANAPMRIELGASEISQAGTPTPSSPQDIHTISGSNKVVVCGKNFADNKNLNLGYTLNNTGGLLGGQPLRTTLYLNNIKPNTTITASLKNGYEIGNLFYYDINQTYLSQITSAWENTKTFTTPNNAYYISFATRKSNNETMTQTDIDNLNPQLEYGSTATTYEPYISQEADIYLGGENLFNINTIRWEFLNDSNGNVNANTSWRCTPFESNLKKNTTYTLSWKSSSSYFQANIVYYDANKTYISSASLTRAGYYDNSFTTPSNFKYYKIAYAVSVSGNDAPREEIMLNEGSTALPYQEYYEPLEYCKIGNYEDEFIRTSGEQLFDKTTIDNGKYVKADGTIGTDNTAFMTDYIEITPNTNYYISNRTTWNSIGLYNSSKTFLERINLSYTSGVLNISNTNCKYIRLNASVNDINTMMLNEGTIALPYEPYGTNEWYIKKNIGKVVLDGSENWTSTSASGVFWTTNNDYLAITGTLICKSNRYQPHNEILAAGDLTGDYEVSFNSNKASYPRLYLKNKDCNGTTALTSELNTHNTNVYYVLATPTYTQITGTLAEQLENVYQKMLSYTGQTNINQVNNDLSFNLSVQAIEDLN